MTQKLPNHHILRAKEVIPMYEFQTHYCDHYNKPLAEVTDEDFYVCPGAGCDICDHCKPIPQAEQQESE